MFLSGYLTTLLSRTGRVHLNWLLWRQILCFEAHSTNFQDGLGQFFETIAHCPTQLCPRFNHAAAEMKFKN